ncbi:hypothetical protein LshimejAT787_2000950 [Lyophyllum shimeji]|uniref:Uncharacterized protein n=1 Tax=Lyophyllum shimeji TaxID=47721 RepID=A0A9P3UUW7_LYOSH|nr:hypothetical protein LshimejAT787_2000950 [Lyophyllum shimeji]
MSFSDSFGQSGVIVYRIPPELLLSRIGSGAPVGEAPVEVILDLEPLEIDDWFLLEPLCSPVGLQALWRDLTDDQFPSTHAYLQPVDWDRRISPDTAASTTVRLDGDMEIHAWSASGTQAAVILDRRAVYGSDIEPDPPVTLALLRFSARGIDAQDLVLPEGLKGDAVIDSVAIDERSGVVYLGTPERLFVLRFA